MTRSCMGQRPHFRLFNRLNFYIKTTAVRWCWPWYIRNYQLEMCIIFSSINACFMVPSNYYLKLFIIGPSKIGDTHKYNVVALNFMFIVPNRVHLKVIVEYLVNIEQKRFHELLFSLYKNKTTAWMEPMLCHRVNL